MRSTSSFVVALSLSLAAQAAPEKMQAAEVGEGGALTGADTARAATGRRAKCSSRCVRPA